MVGFCTNPDCINWFTTYYCHSRRTSEFKGYEFEIKKLKSVEISFPPLPKLQQTVKQTQKKAIIKL